jgi:hypothetical protein
MDSWGSGARIVLSRAPGGWRDRLRSYVVMVDDSEVGKVKPGERLEIPITAGRHQVFLKISWCRSPTLEVEVGPDDVIEMSCAPGGPPSTALGDVLGDRDAYISLTRS